MLNQTRILLIIGSFYFSNICIADVKDDIKSIQLQYEKNIEYSQGSLKRTSSLNLTRTQTSEIIRGQDLSSAVDNSLLRTQTLIENQKEITKNAMSNKNNMNEAKKSMAKDMIQLQKDQQLDSRRKSAELQQALKEKNQLTRERIRDSAQMR